MRAGVWKHRRSGDLYLVLGAGHDSDYEWREVVIYVPLYTRADRTGPRLAVRTRDEFEDRFDYLGEGYRPWMEEA
jgi:hypothetical protein